MKKDESISLEEEAKLKKISTLIMIIIISLGLLITTDIFLATKGIGPFLAIRVKVYADGGTKEYYGLGYKVIKYNQKIGRKDTIVGPFSLKYNTNPKTYTIEELSYSIVNDNYNHIGEFVRLKGTISKKSNKDNTLTLKFTDNLKAKYNLTIKANLLSENIKSLNENSPVTIIGVVKSFDKKTKTLVLINAFAK